jgi:hypothetical protein
LLEIEGKSPTVSSAENSAGKFPLFHHELQAVLLELEQEFTMHGTHV